MAQNGVEAEQLSTNLVDCPMAGRSVDYQVLPTAHGQFKLPKKESYIPLLFPEYNVQV